MAFEHSRETTLKPVTIDTSVVIFEGRALSSAEVLGLPGEPPARRRALALLLSGWIGLLLIASDPLAGIVTLFLAPTLLVWMKRQQA